MSTIDASDVASFERDGFLIKRAYFHPNEMAALLNSFNVDPAIHKRAYGVDDGQGGATEIALWNEPGEDAFGAVARGERLVRAAEKLLGGEVYHYHSKITMKRPGAGGTWVWHQDYGYWYSNGCLRPEMLTVAIPLTPNNIANGCLNVLAGSHLMGRVEHGFVGHQTGADPARVAEAEKQLPRVAFEAEPGDVMFFHSNTLHIGAEPFRHRSSSSPRGVQHEGQRSVPRTSSPPLQPDHCSRGFRDPGPGRSSRRRSSGVS